MIKLPKAKSPKAESPAGSPKAKLQQTQLFKLFNHYPWLLLSLLAALQMAAVLVYVHYTKQNSAANRSPLNQALTQQGLGQGANQGLSQTPAPRPTVSIPPSLTAPTPAKTATKSATKNQSAAKSGAQSGNQPGAQSSVAPSAAAQSAPAKPALTPDQQRLNEQYKQSFVNSAASADNLIEMKVAIAEGVGSVAVGGAANVTVMDQNRSPLATLSAGQTYTAQPSSTGISLNGSNLPQIILLEPANGGTFNLGNRTYRGRLLLANDSGKIWAVNLVNLRHYLHSVVASEVSPSWPQEALKAQSVAARSYALTYYFKPMSSLFDLGATEYYQVYSGIDREASETNQAVDATAGEFVSYQGGIVESLYAASDDIVAEAFQGRGMSQLGALSLAEQGYSYQQILGGYYPGTGLGKFVADYQ
jgi:stage II sporulation protein D